MARLFENVSVNIQDSTSDALHMLIAASEKYKKMSAPLTVDAAAELIIFGIKQSTDLTDERKDDYTRLVENDLQFYHEHKMTKRDFFAGWKQYLNRGKAAKFK